MSFRDRMKGILGRHNGRNAEAAETFQREAAARAITEGRVNIGDRLGKRLEVGCQVLMVPPDAGLVFVLEDIKPILDPRAPVGAVQLLLTAKVGYNMVAGQRAQSLVMVGAAPVPQPEAPAESKDAALPSADQAGERVEGDRGEVVPGPRLVTEH